jgi:hypothetical protein
VPFLPIDIVVKKAPANTEGRFSSWSNITDLIDALPSIGDE